MREVRVQAGDFDPGAELARLEGLGGGAVASFIGLVRGGDGLVSLTLEHHPGMAAEALRGIAEAAAERWPLLGIVLVHRHGTLRPGERIVLCAVASPHREAAFKACAFLIDRAKTSIPFWKREAFADGTSRWIEAMPEARAPASRPDLRSG